MHVVICVSDRVVEADIAEWLSDKPSVAVKTAQSHDLDEAIVPPLEATILVVQGAFSLFADSAAKVLDAGGQVIWFDAPPECEKLPDGWRRLATPYTASTLEAVFWPFL